VNAFAQVDTKYASSTIRAGRISTATPGLVKYRHEGTVATASTGEKELNLELEQDHRPSSQRS
jgi:hypothetical protein